MQPQPGCHAVLPQRPPAPRLSALIDAPSSLPIAPAQLPLNHRAMASTAELVFMPYNYLIDARTRSGLGIRWQDAILIFDEAHNVEVS